MRLTTAARRHGGMRDCPDVLATKVLDAAFDVHRELGAGLLESVYEAAMAIALAEQGFNILRQTEIMATYRGYDLGVGFRADLIVEDCLLLELKAVDVLLPVHLAQVMTYLKMLDIRRGYLLNFNVRLLKEGIKRVSL